MNKNVTSPPGRIIDLTARPTTRPPGRQYWGVNGTRVEGTLWRTPTAGGVNKRKAWRTHSRPWARAGGKLERKGKEGAAASPQRPVLSSAAVGYRCSEHHQKSNRKPQITAWLGEACLHLNSTFSAAHSFNRCVCARNTVHLRYARNCSNRLTYIVSSGKS